MMIPRTTNLQTFKPNWESLKYCQGIMAPKYTKYSKLIIRSNTELTNESSDSRMCHASHPNAFPAAKETNNSSTPKVEPTPAQNKDTKAEYPKNDSLSIKSLFLAN
ncbi:hypothetical protein WICPIJ_004210 [Wickerhamomyces pijperi]|uniref:Uncharacterized protein n=1 Tax=Wickerhamomyces pijperi TaxID=599730 RepID=A0A9P8TN49_WICPI|nr:hypothetical protein WICPIJ_004210 [Wickerhamomyces pijperi]